MICRICCNDSTDIQPKKNLNKFLLESMDAEIGEWQSSSITVPAKFELPGIGTSSTMESNFMFLESELDRAKLSISGKYLVEQGD